GGAVRGDAARMRGLRRTAIRVWRWLRALLGDDAYERYVRHVRRRHPGRAPLARGDFYRAELDSRWSQVNRCC
ncbi:MAG: YbdD/YjiX family protein, partial [Gemmatimonadetes bacterium]|nr:YbdD/YjiX family protein [Gemmatimonadota bacterium]